MRPRGLSTIVDHFAKVLPRRAFDDVSAVDEGLSREAAYAFGVNDATLPQRLRTADVAIVDETRIAVQELIALHGINPNDGNAIDQLNEFLLGEHNPFIMHVRSLLKQALQKYRDRLDQ